MEALIKIINELQEVFSASGLSEAIELPQIVVVGDQSSGKSSVLESLAMKSFLPRGTGTVTRCPTVLRLINIPSSPASNGGGDGPRDRCEFKHLSGQKFTDFDEVRLEIERETNRKAGTNKNIVNDPIFISVYSPNMVTLTLVDLPGIVRLRSGDQPEDIQQQVRKLIKKYTQNPNSIILAVSAANNDIQASESLQFAKEADPNGDRTLAIFTKLDLMDNGTDAEDVLTGQSGVDIPAKLGIVGVVNRSQQDIKDNKTIERVLEDERIFLEKHYPTLASKNGTLYLRHKLNVMLMEHIKKCLPDLETRITELVGVSEEKLAALGGSRSGSPEDKESIMIRLIDQFCGAYKGAVDGDNNKLETEILRGGAKIRHICETRFDELLADLKKCEFEVSDEEIKTAIRNLNGYEAILGPHGAFQSFVRIHIQKMRTPLVSFAVAEVHNELKALIKSCVTEEICRYPKFRETIESIVNDMWNKRLKKFKKKLEEYIKIEVSHIYTDDEDFKKESEIWLKKACKHTDEIPVGAAALSRQSFAEQLNENCEVTKNLTKIYFQIVLKNTKGHFRKSLAFFVINYAKDNLLSELTSKLYPGRADELIQEDEQHARERAEAVEMIEALGRATEIIARTRSNVSYKMD